MAYTIISQNNNTTTLSDGVNTITVPSRVNLTSGNFTIVEVNNNMATLEDGDGNVYRDIPCVATLAGEGGGGGSGLPDQTGHSGEFLTTDGTDASWSDKPLVNNVNSIYSIALASGATASSNGSAIGYNCNGEGGFAAGSSSRSKNGAGVGTSAIATGSGAVAVGRLVTASGASSIQLGDGNVLGGATNSDANTFKVANASGNFEMMSADGTIPTARFTTDPVADGTYYPTLTISSGTPTRSWSTISALQNTATGTDSIATGTATAAGNQSTAFGGSAEASVTNSTAYGYGAAAKTNVGTTAVGASSQAVGQWSSAYGFEAQARSTNCIQLGSGSNNTSGTLKVGFKNSGNYELLNNQGFIPTARLTKVNSTITLTAAGWSSNTQTVSVTGMTTTGVVLVSPDPTDQADYTSAGILCTAQAADSLTFTCSTTPTADIDVNVVML